MRLSIVYKYRAFLNPEQWVWCVNIETRSTRTQTIPRRIRKRRGITKQTHACAKKTHRTQPCASSFMHTAAHDTNDCWKSCWVQQKRQSCWASAATGAWFTVCRKADFRLYLNCIRAVVLCLIIRTRSSFQTCADCSCEVYRFRNTTLPAQPRRRLRLQAFSRKERLRRLFTIVLRFANLVKIRPM